MTPDEPSSDARRDRATPARDRNGARTPGTRRARSHSPSTYRRRRSALRRWAPFIAFCAVALLLVGAMFLLLGGEDTATPAGGRAADAELRLPARERTAALPPLKLPADDAPHGSGMEWWYYSGILDGEGAGRFAFHVAVFVANGLIKHTAMHVALTDLSTGRRHLSQRRTGGAPASDVRDGFDFRQDDWQVSAADGMHRLRLALPDAALSLELRQDRPAIAHRLAGSATPGLIDFGASGISYYYSRPRMSASGEVRVAGRAVPVRGEVWFDHQWGDFDVLGLGWNWFALHLSDGSDLMLYELFDERGRRVALAGTRSRGREVEALAADAVELRPVRRWTSPATRISYPVEWRLRQPTGELLIQPLFDDAEFDASATTSNVYWEGPVRVSGSAEGEGFLELSGHDRRAAVVAPGGR